MTDHPKAFEKILHGDKSEFIMCASTRGAKKAQDTVSDLGLVALHAYALIAAAEVVGSDGKNWNIVKLRNPWGDTEWQGDWSDNSKLWTPKVKKDCK